MNKLLLFLLIFTFNQSIAQVPASEKNALIDLAISTDYVNWGYFDWDVNNPVSTWYGVTVTNISGTDHVTEIDLQGNNLRGSLPESIGDLPFLTSLAFPANEISGSIPETIGNLINLTFLNLFQNSLTGSIPSSLGNLLNLEQLVLFNNQLSGNIPSEIGLCAELVLLDLGTNLLTGEIPNELSNLAKMRWFYINDTLLTGDITNIYSSWPNLSFFIMNDTLLTGDLDLSNNPNLYNFWATNCSLTSIDIKSGVNSTINAFSTINSSNLTCIQIDDEIAANNGSSPYTNWGKDVATIFSENCNSLSTSDYVLNNDLHIYPNPVTNDLFIEYNLSSYTEISVYNMLGEKIFSTTISNGVNKIDFSKLDTGTYFVKSKDEFNNFGIKKVIKE